MAPRHSGKKTAPDTFFPRHLSRGERRPEEENTNILFFSVLCTFQVREKREKSVSSSLLMARSSVSISNCDFSRGTERRDERRGMMLDAFSSLFGLALLPPMVFSALFFLSFPGVRGGSFVTWGPFRPGRDSPTFLYYLKEMKNADLRKNVHLWTFVLW